MKNWLKNTLSIACILGLSVAFAVTVDYLSAKPTPPVSEPGGDTATTTTTTTTQTSGATTTTTTVSKPQFTTAPEGYFRNALFIGDSRTVGLSEYGGLDEATYFAYTGLNVFKLHNEQVAVKGIGKITLDQLLAHRRFNSVYLMTGVNELGYDLGATLRKYTELVEKIRRTQPDAVIYIQANMHVAKALSATSDIYNNHKINAFNEAIRPLADNKTVFYLDVNPLFDDAEGNLDAQYTFDNSHLLGKYYRTWTDWLATSVILPQ